MKKYIVTKGSTLYGKEVLDTIDILYESPDGFEWICECGWWESPQAIARAEQICALLNATLKKENKND
jgi:hypothetical protein